MHWEQRTAHPPLSTFFQGERLLGANAEALFGAPASRRHVCILVTLPAEAAEQYELLLDLLQRGMDCVRINCAHKSTSVWEAIIAQVRRAEGETKTYRGSDH